MTTVTLTVATVSQNFPTGTSGGQWSFQILQNGVVQQTTLSPNPTLAITTLLPGTYTATCQRLNSLNGPIGGLAQSAPFVVPDPGVNITVADAAQPIAVVLS